MGPARRVLRRSGMVATDRAFRALARAEPHVVLALLRLAVPDFLEHICPGGVLSPDAVEDPKLDLPPPLEADLIARAGDSGVLHVEGQGYDERAFDRRVFNYHLALVLRHPTRAVSTVALWLVPPPRQRRLGRIELNGVIVRVRTVVLGDLPASLLLSDSDAVCFAPGADPEHRSAQELCTEVARTLRDQRASWQRLLVSAVVAAAAGRYDAMIVAMQEAGLEPPIIEDLVRYGRERGLREGVEQGRREGVEQGRREGVREGVEQGRREGVEQGRREGVEEGLREGRVTMARESLLELLALRGLTLSAEQVARVEAETAVDRLKEWFRRATSAASAGDVFLD